MERQGWEVRHALAFSAGEEAGDELFYREQLKVTFDGEMGFPPAGLNSENLRCSLWQGVFSRWVTC